VAWTSLSTHIERLHACSGTGGNDRSPSSSTRRENIIETVWSLGSAYGLPLSQCGLGHSETRATQVAGDVDVAGQEDSSWLASAKGEPVVLASAELPCLVGLAERYKEKFQFAYDDQKGLMKNLLGHAIELVVESVMPPEEVCVFISQTSQAMAHQPACMLHGSRYCMAVSANSVKG